MSGGVDSSLSAALLLEQGYEVVGAFMKNWSGGAEGPRCADPEQAGESFEECGWKEERRDAMRVAAQLGIPFVTFDFEKEYRALVVDEMFRAYAAGRTPNPDVLCNRFVKFDLFVKEADKLGCDFVATGHYARVEDGRLLRAADENKDQTYFLWAVPPAALSRVLFPVGHLTKLEVRAEAEKRGLSTAGKKDSTGICFVGEVDMKAFLRARIPDVPGNVVSPDGEVLGRHDGLSFYTIGQRHGLDLGGGPARYVAAKRRETNELVAAEEGHPSLFRGEVEAAEANWFRQPELGARCQARIRHRQPLVGCIVWPEDNGRVRVVFNEPQRGVSSGQSVVLYDGEDVLGGAVIQ